MLRLHLNEAQRLAELVVSVVIREDADGVRDGRDLLSPGLRALLVLLVQRGALRLQVRKELGVRREGCLGVRLVLLVGGVLLRSITDLLLLVRHLVPGGGDLLGLRRLHVLELRLSGVLLLGVVTSTSAMAMQNLRVEI